MTERKLPNSVTVSWKTLFLSLAALNVGVIGGYAARTTPWSDERPPAVAASQQDNDAGELQLASTGALICQEDPKSGAYITADRFKELKTKVENGDVAGLGQLDDGQMAIVGQVMDREPGAAFFVDRIARSMGIVDSMAKHLSCTENGGTDCTLPADIEHFREMVEAKGPDGWKSTYQEWQGFLKTDIDNAQACFSA